MSTETRRVRTVCGGLDVDKGPCFLRPEEDRPPRSITFPEQYQGASQLNVVCTQTRLPPVEQRRLVNRWRALLPTLDAVECLWLSSRVPQGLFESVCLMSNLRGLYVNWSGIKDLSSLRKLTRLRCLHLGSSTQVTSIDVLAELRRLFWLELENLRGIHDFSPLAALTQLVGLSLEGSAWRTQIVDSLEPIGRLKELRYLSLSNLRAKDRNLAPLIHLKKLRRLCLAPWWNKQDLAALKRSLPELLDP